MLFDKENLVTPSYELVNAHLSNQKLVLIFNIKFPTRQNNSTFLVFNDFGIMKNNAVFQLYLIFQGNH